MGKYLFGTGIIGAVMSGLSLLKDLRSEEPFTWRTAMGWLSWGVTFALAIGAIVDTRRALQGRYVSSDSPVHGKQDKLRKHSGKIPDGH